MEDVKWMMENCLYRNQRYLREQPLTYLNSLMVRNALGSLYHQELRPLSKELNLSQRYNWKMQNG